MTMVEPGKLRTASIRRHVAGGIAAVFVLFGGIGGWAATTELAGAVIAPGSLVVESNSKKVQHPAGGIISELHVEEGARAKAGDILIRLDGTQVRANLQIITDTIDELTARRARLEAERDGAETIIFPDELLGRATDAEIAAMIAGEKRLFASRREGREGQRAQFRERIAQLHKQIEGLRAQDAAKTRESEAFASELEIVRKLHADKLTTLTRLLELEREAAQLEGNRGQITSEIAQASGRIAELELQILQIDQELRSEAGGQLSDLRARLSEVIQRKSAAADELRRLDIRAPQEGTVLQLAVHTVGGVIEAGELLMLIVPEADPLAVEARVSPTEIDRLHVGQSVMLRFPSFNQQTTPQITGKLARISPDSTEDKRTGMSYYTLQIVIPVDQIRRLGEAKLLPGMPVEAFIATEERTVLSYLAKPLSDHLTRAFRQR